MDGRHEGGHDENELRGKRNRHLGGPHSAGHDTVGWCQIVGAAQDRGPHRFINGFQQARPEAAMQPVGCIHNLAGNIVQPRSRRHLLRVSAAPREKLPSGCAPDVARMCGDCRNCADPRIAPEIGILSPYFGGKSGFGVAVVHPVRGNAEGYVSQYEKRDRQSESSKQQQSISCPPCGILNPRVRIGSSGPIAPIVLMVRHTSRVQLLRKCNCSRKNARLPVLAGPPSDAAKPEKREYNPERN